ncbi:MAG: hypothetical protein JRJ38_16015 [Deltaproteobacteria bacterium]|nr:hypothetical protein [Deltaproteobacteria bacterium]
MKALENIYQVAFILLSSVGGAALIIVGLSSWLGKVWANRILESEKAKYAKELDKIRHQFQIELDQLSIIHENQKNSFQRVIKALNKSIKALEQPYDEGWQPINDRQYDELQRVIIEESLFLGSEGERALDIFMKFFGRSTCFPEEPLPSDKMLRNIYEHMGFIAERIREYFRKRIGLSDEPDPLWDVNLLSACLLINDYHFREADFPTKTNLKFEYDISPNAFVEKVKQNLDVLKEELRRFIDYLESDPEDTGTFFCPLSEARYYLNLLNKKA